MRASQGDHSPIRGIDPELFKTLLKIFADHDKIRAQQLKRLKAHSRRVNKDYPDHVPIAPLWRAFAAFTQHDVGKFAYFVERVDPFDVRFTLPVVMCASVCDVGVNEAFQLPFDQEAFATIICRTVTHEAFGFFRDHLPHFADGSNQLCLLIAQLMVDGSKEQLKFLMMGAHGGCGECGRLLIEHLECKDPVREGPRPLFEISRRNRARPRRPRGDDREAVGLTTAALADVC
ncbi:hypothetical protein JL720_13149 [Aureococcus anophagefferens]|nr:hypothetical protein JL720_13149 [Aureococcus anophagefferens]